MTSLANGSIRRPTAFRFALSAAGKKTVSFRADRLQKAAVVKNAAVFLDEDMYDAEDEELVLQDSADDEDDEEMLEDVLDEDEEFDSESEELEEGAYADEEKPEGADVDEPFKDESEGVIAETGPAGAPPSGCPEGFLLNFLWLDKLIAIAIDQLYNRGQRSPLTEYFVWPRSDAWEELRQRLEENPWIDETDQVLLLNRATEVINYWQDEEANHTLEDARIQFPDCVFMGS